MIKVQTSNKVKFIFGNKAIKLAIDKFDNFINIEGVDYFLDYLDKNIKGSKGGNSNVFLLRDPEEDEFIKSEDLVIKICKFSNNKHKSKFHESRRRRFAREIIAHRNAIRKKLSGTIKYFENGVIDIGGFEFSFFTMEKAGSDLTSYLDDNSLELQQKLVLCFEIVESFKELHSIELYHRDIKHDNILIRNGKCKVGDLGLYKYKDEDSVDEIGERIGAFGWESPETMNKSLTESKENTSFSFDCEIDYKSDIFQLGKLFWYIMQGNLPIGQISKDDFLIKDDELFNVLKNTLSHNKERRPDVFDLDNLLQPIYKKHNVI